MTTNATKPEDDPRVLALFQPKPNPFARANSEAGPADEHLDEETQAALNALARCLEAHNKARHASLEGKQNPNFLDLGEAQQKALQAYRESLPPIAGEHGVACFLACVNHGLLIGAITERVHGKLLYAAQIAQSRPQRAQTRPAKP